MPVLLALLFRPAGGKEGGEKTPIEGRKKKEEGVGKSRATALYL